MGLFCFSRSQTIIPPRRVYQTRQDAEFKVEVDVKCCIHGYLAKDKKQPASLIIFASQLACVDNGKFNLFRMEVSFHDQDESGNPCAPVVISTAPYSVEERLDEEIVEFKNKITTVVKKTKKVTATAGLTVALLNAGLDGELGSESQKTKELEYSTQVHYFSKGSSNTRVDDDSGRRYAVWWNVKKNTNPKTGDDAGIPPNYLFAVLLTRTNDSIPFEARYRLFAEAGWAHRKEKIIDIVTRHLTKKGKEGRPSSVHRPLPQELADFAVGNYEGIPKPMVFDPRTKFEGDCQGTDRLQLGKYKKDDELQKLTMKPKP
jgi:hypothetical protein